MFDGQAVGLWRGLRYIGAGNVLFRWHACFSLRKVEILLDRQDGTGIIRSGGAFPETSCVLALLRPGLVQSQHGDREGGPGDYLRGPLR